MDQALWDAAGAECRLCECQRAGAERCADAGNYTGDDRNVIKDNQRLSTYSGANFLTKLLRRVNVGRMRRLR